MITHPRATLVAEYRWQGDAERETARTRPRIDILTPKRERLSTNHRRHRPATRMLLHLEYSLNLFEFDSDFDFDLFKIAVKKKDEKKNQNLSKSESAESV